MSRRIAVIGGGASGTAAAYAAAKLGARVTLIMGGPGATSLASGALDGDLHDAIEDAREFVDALGVWTLGGCRLATSAGLLRVSNGRDRSLLDLGNTEPGVVAVVDVLRRGWEAKALADGWTREPWAIDHGLRFETVAIEVLRYADEGAMPLADLAARHDDPERVAWLIDRLRESTLLREKRAVVMGPWLGLRAGVASEVTRSLGTPVGEPLSVPGGAAGWRFERARDALLSSTGIERVSEWAVQAQSDDREGRVELASGSSLAVDAVVVTTGGLVGGGVEWSPDPAATGFAMSLRQAGSLALNDRPLKSSGSPEGALFEEFSWQGGSTPTGIERVGIWTDREGRVRRADGSVVRGLFAAGDVVADLPRTLLTSIRSGLLAGSRAAR